MQLWPKVYAYGFSLVRDGHRAEDLCQETYLRFFGMKRTVDRSRPLLPLLLSILRNRVASESRRPRTASLDDHDTGEAGLPDDATETPLKVAVRHEEKDTVQAALARLSPDWRSVLYLRDGLGFSYREIGEVVERSEDSVRVTLHRARQKVRELLKDMDLDERRAQ
jgi:RNA polymerase sigma-70 factor (ECF subfamily)